MSGAMAGMAAGAGMGGAKGTLLFMELSTLRIVYRNECSF